MTDTELRDAAVAALKATTVSYPEWLRRSYPDRAKTKWGQAFALLAQIGAAPPVPPTTGTAAAPRPPVTVIQGVRNVAVNLTGPFGGVVQDYAIDDCGDQSVLLHQAATGYTVRRIAVTRPGQNPRDLQVSGALHALYLKAPGNVIEDFVADYSRNIGASLQTNALSVRKRDNVLRRTEVRGPVALAAAYFEEDTTKGVVTFDQGRWEFTGDTALWVDGAIQSFVLRGIHVEGPGLLARFKNHTGDFVRVEGCTVRGRPAAEADVAGARGLTVV